MSERSTRPATTTRAASTRCRPRRPQAGSTLAGQLIPHVLWLTGTHPQRLAPRLARYERAGWSGHQLATAMSQVNIRMGWASPASDSLRTGAWNLLRHYLDQIDPQDDHPQLVEQLLTAERQAQQAARRLADRLGLASRAEDAPDQ